MRAQHFALPVAHLAVYLVVRVLVDDVYGALVLTGPAGLGQPLVVVLGSRVETCWCRQQMARQQATQRVVAGASQKVVVQASKGVVEKASKGAAVGVQEVVVEEETGVVEEEPQRLGPVLAQEVVEK